MLVLFQIFLMMALSSSLACSKLPGDKGQAARPQVTQAEPTALDKATSESLTQETLAGFPLVAAGPWLWGRASLSPWDSPALGSCTHFPIDLGSPGSGGLTLKAVVSRASPFLQSPPMPCAGGCPQDSGCLPGL